MSNRLRNRPLRLRLQAGWTSVCAIACLAVPSPLWAETNDSASPARTDRFVTHFEVDQQVTYQPQAEVVRQPRVVTSWNPFRRTSKVVWTDVPVVRWSPSMQRRVVPVTERQMAAVPTNESLDIDRSYAGVPGWRPRRDSAPPNSEIPSSAIAAEAPMVARRDQDGVPNWAPSRPTQTQPTTPVAPAWGGIQRLDDEETWK